MLKSHKIWNKYNPDNIVTSGYVIHHKDGNHSNNDILNLELLGHSEHTRLHMIGNLFWLNKNHTEESKLKNKIAHIGKMVGEDNPMFGIRLMGELNGFYGKKHSNESKQKMSLIKRGKKFTEEHKMKISESNKGKKRTEETKKRISDSLKGEKHHLWGKHHSEETKLKMSKAMIGIKKGEGKKRKGNK